MNRRSFASGTGLSLLGGAASFAAQAAKPRPIFLWEQFFLKNGTQPARLHEYLSNGVLPAMKRAGTGPALVVEALVTPHMPQISTITQFDSVEHFRSARTKMASDKDHQKAFESWEEDGEQPYEHFSAILLQATDYSPALAVDKEPRKQSRIFEIRVYHSPTWRQLAALHERFSGPEIKIFHRVGIHPILYSSTQVGPNMPNLTYVIPFDDLAAREKAWAAFSADAEWVKVRKESIDRHGQISSISQIGLYRATPYSPIR
jgi:hypothetical protein